jgi:hypothetical protein
MFSICHLEYGIEAYLDESRERELRVNMCIRKTILRLYSYALFLFGQDNVPTYVEMKSNPALCILFCL